MKADAPAVELEGVAKRYGAVEALRGVSFALPQGGRVVAAPLDGVIAEFLVKPNQSVAAGDLLVRFDATTLKAQADVAERALGVAEAELKANSKRAFADADTDALLTRGRADLAALNTILSVGLGVLAAVLGRTLGTRL